MTPHVVAVLVVLALVCGGASLGPYVAVAGTGETRVTNGPLRGLLGLIGGFRGDRPLRLPHEASWWQTFGYLPACTMDEPVVIDRIRLETTHPPLDMRAWVRRMEAGPDWAPPFIALTGRPPRWDQPYVTTVEDEVAGEYEPARGARIDRPCGPVDDVGVAEAFTWRGSYDDIVVALHAGPEGARSTSFWVDYTADGRPYTTHVLVETTLCGVGIPPGICSSP